MVAGIRSRVNERLLPSLEATNYRRLQYEPLGEGTAAVRTPQMVPGWREDIKDRSHSRSSTVRFACGGGGSIFPYIAPGRRAH
jgi:hypothetical protein